MREKNLSQKIMPWFIVIIMVSSVLGVIFYGYSGAQATQTEKYNGFKFQRIENKWVLQKNNDYLVFDYLPQEVENISLSDNTKSKFSGIEIDTTFSLNDTYSKSIALAIYELANAFQKENIFILQGLAEDNKYQFPVIGCNNATAIVPVIEFKEGNETKISSSGNCVIITADENNNFLKIKDRILYGHYGIIK